MAHLFHADDFSYGANPVPKCAPPRTAPIAYFPSDIDLRRWCVEQVSRVGRSNMALEARELHAFMTEAAGAK